MTTANPDWWWLTLEEKIREEISKRFPASDQTSIDRSTATEISKYRDTEEWPALLYELGRRTDPKMIADKQTFPPWPRFNRRGRIFLIGAYLRPAGVFHNAFEYQEVGENVLEAALFLPKSEQTEQGLTGRALTEPIVACVDLNADDPAIIRSFRSWLDSQRVLTGIKAPPSNTWKLGGRRYGIYWKGIQNIDSHDHQDHTKSSLVAKTRKFAQINLKPPVLDQIYRASLICSK